MPNNFDLNQGLSGKYSILKIFHHPEKMRSFLEEKVKSPVAVRFKPTNRCDDACFYCVYEHSFSSIHPSMKRKDELPREKVMQILSNLSDFGVGAVTYSGGGEPLLHPDITDFFRKTLESKMGLSIITNGHNLQGEKAEILSEADWVRISIDYCDASMLKKIRRRNEKVFRQTKENLYKFAKIKGSNCDLEANCVIHEHNYSRLSDIAHFLKEQGIKNVRFAPCWFPNFEGYHKKFKKVVTEQIEKARQQFADETFNIGSTYNKYFLNNAKFVERPKKCYWMQIVPVIGADNNVYTCHNKAYDNSGMIGTIKDKSFEDLWFSPKTAEFFRKFDPKKKCQHECSSHERNILITEAIACADPKLNRYP